MDSKTKVENYVPEWVKVMRQAILESEKEDKEVRQNGRDRLEQVQ